MWWWFTAAFLGLFCFTFHLNLCKSIFNFQQSVLENLPDLARLVFAAAVSLHIRKNAALVRPVIIFRPKEIHRKLSHLVAKVLDVGRDISGVVDFCRPPSVSSQFDPYDVSVFGFLSSSTVIAEPAPFWHRYVQTVRVKGSRARLAAQQLPTFGADEAPADVDVAVVAVALLATEVVCANKGRVCDGLAPSGHTEVPHVIRNRTAKAAHQPALVGTVLGLSTVVAAEAGVHGAAEALAIEHSERAEAGTGLVVKFTAVRCMTAAHFSL